MYPLQLILVVVLSSFGTGIYGSLHGKTLAVSTVMNDPFMMLKEDSEALVGKNKYEGFNVDLIQALSELLGFNYTIQLVADGEYGTHDKVKGEWSGMIGELQSQKADIVVADMTITYKREQVIDFTIPYMNLGVTILYKKPRRQEPDLFLFLLPFSSDVWMCIIAAYLGMALLLSAIARFIPVENSLPANETEFLTDNAGCRSKAFSTRMIATLWWFFTLMMICWYTASLSAFLNAEPIEKPIESVEDLARQHKIKFGAVQGGSTFNFFRDSKIDTYARMWTYMSQNPNVFTRSNKDGVERVLREDGGYAFMMESTAADYVVERVCELTQVGGLLDNKGYGIGLPLNSPYRKPMSNAILQLQEGGRLQALQEKWWKKVRGGGQCQETPDSGAAALSIANVGGIFVVLLTGLGIATITAITEYLWTVKEYLTCFK